MRCQRWTLPPPSEWFTSVGAAVMPADPVILAPVGYVTSSINREERFREIGFNFLPDLTLLPCVSFSCRGTVQSWARDGYGLHFATCPSSMVRCASVRFIKSVRTGRASTHNARIVCVLISTSSSAHTLLQNSESELSSAYITPYLILLSSNSLFNLYKTWGFVWFVGVP
jgi:hypothetical protein